MNFDDKDLRMLVILTEKYSDDDNHAYGIRIARRAIAYAERIASQVAPQATVKALMDAITRLERSGSTMYERFAAADGLRLLADQAALQATVTNERLKFDEFEQRIGRFARGWESWQGRALLATPPASKANAPATLVGELETFLTEHEITGWREDMFAGLRKIMFSYNQTFDHLSTSKADTGEWRPDLIAAARSVGRAEGREDAFERAAIAAEITTTAIPGRPELFQDPDGNQRALIASNIRALKSATPSTIKAEPIAPAYTTGHCEFYKLIGGCPLPNVHCRYPECDRMPTGE